MTMATKKISYDELRNLGLKAKGTPAAATDKWELGRLASLVEKSYGEDRLGQFAEDLDIPANTVMRYRSVFNAYGNENRPPGQVSPAIGGHSWYVHKVLATQEDRRELLSNGITTKEAELLVRKRLWKGPSRVGCKDTCAGKPAMNPIPMALAQLDEWWQKIIKHRRLKEEIDSLEMVEAAFSKMYTELHETRRKYHDVPH